MAITFRVYQSNTSSSTVDLSGNPPAAGERGLCWSVSDSTSTSGSGPGTGWTQVGGAWVVNTADAQSISVWTKDAAWAGGETSLSITTSTVNLNGAMAIGGLDATTFIDVTIPTPANSSTASASPRTITLAITPATNGALLVAVIGGDTTASTDATFSASDTGGLSWTTRADQNDGFRNVGVCTAIQSSAAATTVTGQATFATGNAGITLFVLALRPAVTAAVSAPPMKTMGSRIAPYLHF